MTDPLPRTPSFRLDGRRALVTGAGRGIGLALAAALAEAGAAVTLAARSSDEIEAGAEAIRAGGGQAEAARLDVADLPATAAFFAARPAFHILVNNAGTNRPMPMQEVAPADYDAVLDLNVRSAFFVAQGCVRRMLADGVAGSLIHIGSQMGHVGGPNRSLYCASKWALEGMSKAFALDLAPHRIRSNTLAPTFIETPMTRPFFADEGFRASVLAKIKLGRLGTVEDLMGAALFLAADASAPRRSLPMRIASVIFIAGAILSGCETGPSTERTAKMAAGALPAGPPIDGDPSRNPDMTDLARTVDANGDGHMSQAEWQAQGLPTSSFDMFEKGRGYVILQDYQTHAAPPGIDLNDDGKLTIEEFREFDRRMSDKLRR